MRSRESRSGTQRWRCATVPRLSIAAAVRPTDTPSAVTMPGQYRDSSLMRTSIRARVEPRRPSTRHQARPRRRDQSRASRLREAVASHGVDSERGEQLAQRVVGREVSVLELVDAAAPSPSRRTRGGRRAASSVRRSSRASFSLAELVDDECGVVAAHADRRLERRAGSTRRDAVEHPRVAGGDEWWRRDLAGLVGERGDRRLEGAARAEPVPGEHLRRVQPRARGKHRVGHAGLHRVVEHGAAAVGVDVGDVVGADVGLGHRLRPRRRHLQTVGLDGDGVERVVGEAAAEHVGVRVARSAAR